MSIMSSTRELSRLAKLGAAVASAALALYAIPGCQFQHNSPPEAGDTDITMNDEAPLHRVWERSHAEYANMTVIAGPLGDPIHPKENVPDYQRTVLEPALFGANTLLLPITLVLYPPWA